MRVSVDGGMSIWCSLEVRRVLPAVFAIARVTPRAGRFQKLEECPFLPASWPLRSLRLAGGTLVGCAISVSSRPWFWRRVERKLYGGGGLESDISGVWTWTKGIRARLSPDRSMCMCAHIVVLFVDLPRSNGSEVVDEPERRFARGRCVWVRRRRPG